MIGIGIGINRRPLGAASYAKQLAKAYEARVIADGGVVESLGCFTAFAEALGAYQPPIALAATGIGETSFTANWKTFKGAEYYLLDVSTSPTFDTFVYENQKINAPTTSYVVIGLNSGTTYYYRVRASTFEVEYGDVLDYAMSQGYTLPSAGQQALQNQLVVDLKDAGIWSKLDTFRVYATDGSEDFALIDWKRLIDCTAVNSPTFTTNSGFEGDGSSSYIDTNFNPTLNAVNASQNDLSIGFWENNITSGSNGVTVGADDSVRDILLTQKLVSSNGRLRLNDNVLLFIPSAKYNIGFVLGQRINTTREAYSPDATLTTDTTTSNGMPNNSITDLSFATLYSSGSIISLGFLGASFTSTQVSDFRTAVTNYMTNI
jgi:hypothetical protein